MLREQDINEARFVLTSKLLIARDTVNCSKTGNNPYKICVKFREHVIYMNGNVSGVLRCFYVG